MDTKHQHEKLLNAFRIKGALTQLKPLATPSVLHIKDADGKRSGSTTTLGSSSF